jgi:hypothetical protein
MMIIIIKIRLIIKNNNNLDKYDKKEFVQIKTCNNFNKYDNLYKKINNEKNKNNLIKYC